MLAGTRCCICTGATTRGQSAHHICGGSLPTDPREYVIAAALHIETRVLRRRPLSLDEIAWRLRPELVGHLDQAMALLQEAGRLSYDGHRFAHARPRRPHESRRSSQLDLFEPPDREEGGDGP
jgi:hypothetical protein